jgi:hypothetical protein
MYIDVINDALTDTNNFFSCVKDRIEDMATFTALVKKIPPNNYKGSWAWRRQSFIQ